MNISKNSWHYKLLAKNNCVIPTSLCSYFWKVVFEIAKYFGWVLVYLISIILSIGICFLGGEMIITMFGWFDGYSILKPESYAFIPLLTTFLLGFLLFSFVIFLPAIIGFISFKYDVWKMSRKKVSKEDEKTTGKEPNLLISYLKAKKQKVCPMITFTEEKK